MRIRATIVMLGGLFGLMATAAQPARAQEPADKTDAAHRVLGTVFTQASYEKITESVAAQLPPEARADIPTLLPSYQEMADFQLGLLVKYFTTSELNEMSRFYASPAGRKTIKVMPEIAADAQGFLMNRIQTEMPKLVAKLKQQKAAAGPSAPAPSPTDTKSP